MASVEEFAERKYFNASDFGGAGGELREVMITYGEKKTFEEKDGSVKVKFAFDIEGEDMKWLANVTNLRIISKVHGDDYNTWEYPFPVTLYAIPTPLGDGISVRL